MALAVALLTTSPAQVDVEIIAGANIIVDSNVLSPSTYAPDTFTIQVVYCNNTGSAIHNLYAHVGNIDGGGTTATPGTYPIRGDSDPAFVTQHPDLDGDYSFTHAAPSADATRFLGTLDPGECVTIYWMLCYPRVSNDGSTPVWGETRLEDDDLWLELDAWASQLDSGQIDPTNAVGEDTHIATMKNSISAMANKIGGPTGGVWTVTDINDNPINPNSPAKPGEVIKVCGTGFRLGVDNKGFDINQDFAFDYGVWIQPVGDKSLFDPFCYRLVRTEGQLRISRSGGNPTYVLDFVDQTYFTDLPNDTNGGVGDVCYHLVAMDGPCSAALSPYQLVASGAENEKFNADFGAAVPEVVSQESLVQLSKTVDLENAAAGATLTYDIDFTNPGSEEPLGLPEYGMPLVLNDAIPTGTTYVSGSAETVANTNDSGGFLDVLYSIDGGVSFVNTEPAPASAVTHIQWWLNSKLQPGDSVHVEFQVSVDDPFAGPSPQIENVAGLSLGDGPTFIEDSAGTLLTGTNNISGMVWEDLDYSNDLNSETQTAGIAVTLYYDANGDGAVDSGDILIGTQDTGTPGVLAGDADSTYAFTNLPDGNYIVLIDSGDADVPSGYSVPDSGTNTFVIDLDAAGASGTPVESIDNDMPLIPALTVAKSADPASYLAGELITYQINLENHMAPVPDPPATECLYTGWATASSATNEYTPAANLLEGAAGVATGSFNAGDDNLEAANFNFSSADTSVEINKVELVAEGFYLDVALGANDENVTLSINGTGGPIIFGNTTVYLADGTPTTFDDHVGAANAADIYIDITSVLSWNWTLLQSPTLSAGWNGAGGSGPAGARPKLSLDTLGLRVTCPVGTTVVDDFATNDYTGSSGSQVWLGNWTEVGDNNSHLADPSFRFHTESNQLRLESGVSDPNPGPKHGAYIYRCADLSTAGSAELTYDASLLGTDGTTWSVKVQTASSSSGPWIDLVTHNDATNNTGTQTATIPSPALSATTCIRVYYEAELASMTFDNFRILYTTSASGTGTASPSTIDPLPLTDDYDPARLQYVSSSVTPTSVNETTGLITWDNVGPLHAGNRTTIEVVFLALQPPVGGDGDPDPASTLNTASSTGATFLNGDTSNDASDTETVTVNPGGSIGDTIYWDVNGDGSHDPDGADNIVGTADDEVGLAGVLIGLDTDGDGTPDQTTVTDADGFYEFTALPSGTYDVIIDSTNYNAGGSLEGFAGTDDPDGGTGGFDDTSEVTIGLDDGDPNNDSFDDQDFGLDMANNIISGTLWYDYDGDGVQDPNEPPIVGQTVNLSDGSTATTDSSGFYIFSDVPDGNYTVSTTAPGGTVLTTPANPIAVDADSGSLIDGTIFPDNDFGFQPSGSLTLGDTLYVDWDGDGTQDVGEEGIANVDVLLFADIDGDGVYDPTVDTLIDTDTTDASGNYQFTGLASGGDYLVVVDTADTDFPANLTQSQDPDGTLDSVGVAINLTTNDDTYDFGYQPLGSGSIGDTVFVDSDGDGIHDSGEPGIENITVTLYEDSDGDGELTAADAVIGTAVTDANGNYLFEDLAPGNYLVDVDGTDSDLPTETAVDGVTTLNYIPTSSDPHPVTLTSGEAYDDADFGFAPGGAIGNFVWEDLDGDGNFDDTEPPLVGASVNLYLDTDGDGTGDILVDTTTTDSNGLYLFDTYNDGGTNTGLPEGDYVVELVTTASQTVTYDYDGGQTSPNETAPLTLLPGQTFGAADFGVTDSSTLVIGDTVWIDSDGDGIVDANETLLSGIKVELLASDGSTVLQTAYTDADGNYMFGVPDDGSTYSVRVDESTLPFAGLVNTSDKDGDNDSDSGQFTLSGSDVLDADFGYQLSGPYDIKGTVFNDIDSSMVWDPLSEPTYEDVTVYLWYTPDGGTTWINVDSQLTGPNGSYSFDGYPAGDYTVAVATSSPVLIGTDPTTSQNTGVTIVDSNVSDVDFGFVGTASIGDTVFYDANGNGSQDGLEAGIPGVPVTLTYPNGQTVTTTTDSSGNYLFEGLGEGPYTITIDDSVITGATNTADPDGSSDSTTLVNLTEGQTYEDGDFGYQTPGDSSIGDTIWADLDGDGSYEPGDGEYGIEGVTVALYVDEDKSGDFSAGDTLVGTTTTDPNGVYGFSGLDANDYVVVATDTDNVLDGYTGSYDENDGTSSPDGETGVILSASTNHDTADFGYEPALATISGTVYDDDDASNDDAINAAEDAPIPGVTITLFSDPNGDGDPSDGVPVAETATDSNGNYSFTDVVPGDYVVVETDPSGFTSDADTNGANDNWIPVDLVGVDSTNNNFLDDGGTLHDIGGTVYNDTADDNALNGAGEDPVAGVTVSLYADTNGNGVYDSGTDVLVHSTVTDSNGAYLFSGLADGNYVVVETDPSGATSDTDADGTGSNDANTVAVILSGADDLDNDFLDDVNTGTIAGSSLDDTGDDDTLNGTGESPIAGTTIALYTDPNGDGDPSDGTIVDTTVTGTDGTYSFTNVAPGDYVVVETQPSGYTTSDDDTSTLIASGTDNWVDVELTAGESDSGNDFLNDGGTLYDLSGNVYVDTGNDDTLDGNGETPMGGVTVTLYADSNGNGVFDAGEPMVGTTATNTDGTYLFGNLTPGNYVVVETDPTGATSDDDAQGSGTDNTVAATIVSSDSVNNDFLDDGVTPAGISGLVYNDTGNDNALNGSGEDPIPGVSVTLYTDPDGDGDPSDGVPVSTTVTSADGSYSFPDLAPGDYVVVETDPSGFTSDADTNGANDNWIPVDLAGVDSTNNNFLDDGGTLYDIGGTVYNDTADDDTLNGAGEDPVAGVTVSLYADTNGNGVYDSGTDVLVDSTVTDSNGEYLFSGLADGNYVVVETDPSGATSDTDADGTGSNDANTVAVALSGADDLDNDFLDDVNTGTIAGSSLDDTGDDDTLNGTGESPIAGTTIALYTDPNGDGDPSDGTIVDTTVTGTDGTYSFTNVAPGDYVVVETQPSGYTTSDDDTSTLIASGTDDWVDVELTAGESDSGNDFLNDGGTLYDLSGTVYVDTGKDDTLDGNDEDPIGGVTITLYSDTNGNGVFDAGEPIVGTTVTNTDGTYLFENLTPGNYVVVETDPTGATSDDDAQGSGTDNTVAATIVTSDSVNNDFLDDDVSLASISGEVRDDTDGDGNPLDSDNGVPGVVITLYTDPNGDGDPGDGVAIDTTTTGSDGSYTFPNLPPGDYVVVETDPFGATSTYDPDGGTTDNTIGVALTGTDSTGNDFLDNLSKAATFDDWQTENPLGGQNGPADNPDGDIYDNTLEYALCLPPDSGVPSHFGYCVEAISSTQYDVTFIRRSGGLTDVRYCVEARSSLPTLGTDTWTVIADIPGTGTGGISGVTITDNGDGTETVRLADIETTAPLTAALGFVRLTIKLDDDGDGGASTPAIESSTMVQGWKITDFTQNQCETFSYPWLQKETFSGSIAGVSGQEVTVTGTPDLSSVLSGGTSYYLEVISGDNEGHRYDVVSANASGVITLAADTDVCAGPPYNTSTTVASDLAGDRFIVRAHHTIDDLFPVSSFTAESDPTMADRLLIHTGGTPPWTNLYVDDPAEWKNEASGLSAGSDVLPPGQGLFIHPQATAGTTSILAMGVVRETDFCLPLNGGYTLVAGGYPIDQSFNSRGLDDSTNMVTGSLDPGSADQIHFWDGDSSPYQESFECYFRIEGTVTGLPAFNQWSNVEDAALNNVSTTNVFECDRAAFYFRQSDTCDADHKLPLPWMP